MGIDHRVIAATAVRVCQNDEAACYRRGRPEYLRTRRVTPHTEHSPSVASIPGQPRTIMLAGPTAARDSPVPTAIHGMHRAVPECDTMYVLTRSARVWPRWYRGTPAPQRMKSTVRFFSSHRVHRPHARTTFTSASSARSASRTAVRSSSLSVMRQEKQTACTAASVRATMPFAERDSACWALVLDCGNRSFNVRSSRRNRETFARIGAPHRFATVVPTTTADVVRRCTTSTVDPSKGARHTPLDRGPYIERGVRDLRGTVSRSGRRRRTLPQPSVHAHGNAPDRAAAIRAVPRTRQS